MKTKGESGPEDRHRPSFLPWWRERYTRPERVSIKIQHDGSEFVITEQIDAPLKCLWTQHFEIYYVMLQGPDLQMLVVAFGYACCGSRRRRPTAGRDAAAGAVRSPSRAQPEPCAARAMRSPSHAQPEPCAARAMRSPSRAHPEPCAARGKGDGFDKRGRRRKSLCADVDRENMIGRRNTAWGKKGEAGSPCEAPI